MTAHRAVGDTVNYMKLSNQMMLEGLIGELVALDVDEAKTAQEMREKIVAAVAEDLGITLVIAEVR